MIITKLQGGLGNQLFQYAAARYLCEMSGDLDLCFDTTYYTYVRNRHYLLNQFAISGRVLRLHEYVKLLTVPKYHENGSFQFDANLQKCVPPVLLDGFWQSAKYPGAIRAALLSELHVKRPQESEVYRKYLDAIKKSESVSVHVRRGDYVNNVNFPVCGLDYYQKATLLVRKQIKQPKFFVFSDDLVWAKNNLAFLGSAVFIEGLHHEIDEFSLMKETKHAIIANSTFSWWAAWLKVNLASLVIAPYPWLTKEKRGDELYIKEWKHV